MALQGIGFFARFGAVIAVGLLAACGRPDNLLLPVAEPPVGTDKVDMLVATTRAPSDNPGTVFTGERGEGLSLANVVVSIPPNRQIGTIQWPQQGPGDPAREFAVTSLSAVPRDGVPKWLASTGKRRVLIFVHGFNTRFDGAVFFFAQFAHDVSANLAPVLFSWPSRGSVFDYVYDRESTNFSRSDLAYVLRAAAASPKVDEVVVMAHSMGAWVTMEALRQIALQDGKIPSKISNLILASPDLDVDVFRRQVVEMGKQRPDITIFVSRNDTALSVSSFIAGGVTRVGAVDLSQEPYRTQLESARGITVLDLTALQAGDPLNHGKFANTPAAVQLLGNRLVAGQSISEGGGKADGAAAVQAVGTAVGTVVAAPILVFTGGMRN